MSKEIIQPLEFCAHTIALKHLIEKQWLILAGQLKEIRDQELFKGRWDSFEDFLNDPTMSMDKSTASKMITIHEKFIIEYKIEPTKISQVGGWSKVAEILPVVKNKKSAEEWLDNAASLSKSDLRKEIHEERTGIRMSSCKHEDYYTVKICRCCGDKIDQK